MHDDIESITTAKVNASKNNLDVVKESFSDVFVKESTDKKQSDEYEAKADQLIQQAKDLRAEADSERDKEEKNSLLKKANSKELEAVTYYDKAADLYVDAAFGDQQKSIAQNESTMSSEELMSKSEALRDQSSTLMNESVAHRDSALLAKGEDKIEMIQRAESKEKQANTLAVVANEYQKSANAQAEVEQKQEEEESLLANLSSDDVDRLKTTDEYKDYFDAENEKNLLKIQKAEKEGEREGFRNIVLQQTQDLKELENKKKEAKDKQEENLIDDQITTLEDAIIVNEEKVEELSGEIESLEELIRSVEQEQENLIVSLPTSDQDDVVAIMLSDYDKTPIAKKTTITFGDLISSNFEVPDKVENDLIVMDQSITYSDENPIPLNPKYPDGLIYKVQVGAFSKPIPNDVFSGFAPISGEQVGDGDLVRYRVGYFVKWNNANDAKNEIRGFGYSDAFVVAIYNGERISLSEARNLETTAGTELLATNTNIQNTNENTEAVETSNNSTDQSSSNNSSTEDNTSGQNETNENINNGNNDVVVNLGDGAAETNDADKIEGLFFTVQLGAFSKPIQATDVYNISPLVTKFIGNLYKYSTGIYRSVDEAVIRKNEVVALGNTDAFVTVYYNGERITVAKAQQLIEEQGEDVFASAEDGQLKQLSPNNNVSQPVETPIEIVETQEEGVYYVDLGTYQGEIPTDLANAMLMVPEYTIQVAPQSEGRKSYYVGYFDNPEDAEKVIELYNSKGIGNLSVGANPPETERSGPTASPGVTYRVYLGNYQGEVPASRGIVFVDLKDEGVEKVIEDDGSETYYAARKTFMLRLKRSRRNLLPEGLTLLRSKRLKMVWRFL